jgi:hypothetical protein
MSDGFLAGLTGLASAGALGAALKALFDRVGEYDKTNYTVIPLGSVSGGDFGSKTAYLRFPRDETSRLLSGMTYKLISSLAGDRKANGLLTELFDFGAGQVPSLNPMLSVPEKWVEYASGIQPVDTFRGRPIVPDTEWKAGGVDSLEPMALWTWDQMGGQNFLRWNSKTGSGLELSVSAIPGINRVVKVSDYGLREDQRIQTADQDKARAVHRLALPDEVQSLAAEYGHLKVLKPALRTPEQEVRYQELNIWHNSVYRKTDEAITAAEQAGDRATAAVLRDQLGIQSRPYARQP